MFPKGKELERRTEITRLGTLSTGLGAMSHCPGPGSDQRRHQPVGQESQEPWYCCTATSQADGCSLQADSRATCSTAPTPEAWSTSVGLSGRGVDSAPYCRSGAAGVWCELPSLTVWPDPQGLPLEQTKAYETSQAERRGGHKALEGGALAAAQKKALEEERTVVFVDESGCYLLPAVVRTYAPTGQTPVLREQFTRDHLSAISGITMRGKLLMRIQDHSFKGPDATRFLKHLVEHVSNRLLVIWDGAPIHRGKPVKEFLASGGAERIRLEPLPGYAPDLNPDEGIWNYLKRVELKNVICQHLGQLSYELGKAIKRLRQKPHIIRACIAQAGLV